MSLLPTQSRWSMRKTVARDARLARRVRVQDAVPRPSYGATNATGREQNSSGRLLRGLPAADRHPAPREAWAMPAWSTCMRPAAVRRRPRRDRRSKTDVLRGSRVGGNLLPRAHHGHRPMDPSRHTSRHRRSQGIGGRGLDASRLRPLCVSRRNRTWVPLYNQLEALWAHRTKVTEAGTLGRGETIELIRPRSAWRGGGSPLRESALLDLSPRPQHTVNAVTFAGVTKFRHM